MDQIEPAEDELTTLICRMTEAVNNLDNYLDDRINNIYLETREATRQSLINRFMNLYVGDMDLDSMDSYAIYMMTKELEEAQALGKLNLETNQGIENLKMIVSKYDK
jgi:hypothetical protein